MEIVVRTHVGAKGGRRRTASGVRAALRSPRRHQSLVSQVSHEGIRPISINGQGDTCCLIVTDRYAQLTVIDHLRPRPRPSSGITREKGGGGKGEK